MWSPAQYEKFKSQRARPFYDLLDLVQPGELRSAVDLGCGTGELTRELPSRLRLRDVLGIDSSPEMLARSASWARPGLRFERCDIADFAPVAPRDLVFSNAALQWVPDHESLLPRVLGWVAPGGQVALQIPANDEHPSHRIARETARRLFPGVFAGDGGFIRALPVERYAEILFANGFPAPLCRVQVYPDLLPSGGDVVEWTRGTLLTAYQARLSEADFARFLEAYRRELLSVIGEGPYLFAFKRILMWGRKH